MSKRNKCPSSHASPTGQSAAAELKPSFNPNGMKGEKDILTTRGDFIEAIHDESLANNRMMDGFELFQENEEIQKYELYNLYKEENEFMQEEMEEFRKNMEELIEKKLLPGLQDATKIFRTVAMIRNDLRILSALTLAGFAALSVAVFELFSLI